MIFYCYIYWTGVKKVVDLCAAPGSWSQVLSRKLRSEQLQLWKLIKMNCMNCVVLLGINVCLDEEVPFEIWDL